MHTLTHSKITHIHTHSRSIDRSIDTHKKRTRRFTHTHTHTHTLTHSLKHSNTHSNTQTLTPIVSTGQRKKKHTHSLTHAPTQQQLLLLLLAAHFHKATQHALYKHFHNEPLTTVLFPTSIYHSSTALTKSPEILPCSTATPRLLTFLPLSCSFCCF